MVNRRKSHQDIGFHPHHHISFCSMVVNSVVDFEFLNDQVVDDRHYQLCLFSIEIRDQLLSQMVVISIDHEYRCCVDSLQMKILVMDFD